MPIEIELTRGFTTVIDDIDADLAGLKWHADIEGSADRPYASRNEYEKVDNYRKTKMVRLHRVILSRKLGRELSAREFCDHKDNNSMNNQRSNLRLATINQNAHNSKRNSNNTSGYKGVTWHKRCQKWQAAVHCGQRTIYLGLFNDPEIAHEAYKAKASELFGEFARFE